MASYLNGEEAHHQCVRLFGTWLEANRWCETGAEWGMSRRPLGPKQIVRSSQLFANDFG